MRWERDGFVIDDDPARIDLDRVVDWLGQTYWAGGLPPETIRRSWQRSGLVVGLYAGPDLVGCARAVTDFARFAYLSDVWIEPTWRGRGLGRWLVAILLDLPHLAGVRWVLHTADAHGLYAGFGFEPADEQVMQRPWRQAGEGERETTSGDRK